MENEKLFPMRQKFETDSSKPICHILIGEIIVNLFNLD